uniref:Uncharacterized protein n=1 Tax=Geladintestivirus 2 TaxID=3233134 RepID=A0AAU8MKW2_9CAUD
MLLRVVARVHSIIYYINNNNNINISTFYTTYTNNTNINFNHLISYAKSKS